MLNLKTLVLALVCAVSCPSCAGPGQLQEMEEGEFQVYLVTTENDTALLSMGWLSDHPEHRGELVEAAATLKVASNQPLAPEDLEEMEGGLVTSLVSVAARRSLKYAGGDPLRNQQVIAAFARGIGTALTATAPAVPQAVGGPEE